MYLFMRVTATAMNYRDGDPELKEPESILSKRQMEQRIIERPSLFEYLTYCNSSITIGVGGFYEFNDFNNLMHRRNHYKDLPSTIEVTLKTLVKALSNYIFENFSIVWEASYKGLNKLFPVSTTLTYFYTSDFCEESHLVKFGSTIIYGVFWWFRFFAFFKLQDVYYTSIGLSFNGNIEGVSKWDRVEGGDGWEILKASNAEV